MPRGSLSIHMDQGYLPSGARLRRAVYSDGNVLCTHTVKRGTGLVREEIEQVIGTARFETEWPQTQGRRVRKTRYESPDRWQIDIFSDRELVLAEIELVTEDELVPVPEWLAPLVVREVTEESGYTNFALAR